MKKFMSLLLVTSLILTMSSVVYADEGYKTTIRHIGMGTSEYTLVVPESMSPGTSSVVSLEGTWTNKEEMVVAAPEKVTLSSDIDGETRDLAITFNDICLIGDNNASVSITENISVANMTGAIFGVWEGFFTYDVKMNDISVPVLVHNGVIPEGAVYYSGVEKHPYDDCYYIGDYTNGTMYTAGQEFPEVKDGDAYIYGDYEYRYNLQETAPGYEINKSLNGWLVSLKDGVSKNNSSYGTILTTINGKDVVSMERTFEGCSNLVTSPAIPDSVRIMRLTFTYCEDLSISPELPSGLTNMFSTFEGCTSLKTPSVIPDGVLDMEFAYKNCTSLTTAPAIPESVVYCLAAFSGCSNMSGTIEINTNTNSMSELLYGTKITWITGSISEEQKQRIAEESFITLVNPDEA